MQEWVIWLLTILGIIFFPGIGFCISIALFDEWIDRKFYAALQDRIGPLHTGFKGILQPLADFLKLMANEDIEPEAADRWGMRFTAVLSLTLPLLALLFVPIVGTRGIISFEGDILLLAFITTIIAVLIYLAGWFSANRLAMPGTMRAASQLLSYEIPILLAMFAVALRTSEFSIAGIVNWQLDAHRPVMFSLPMFCFLLIFLLSTQAELERSPFDIPTAETEIVGGWEVEYSGKKLAFFRLSTDLQMVYGAGIATALFLGGPVGVEMWIPSFSNWLATGASLANPTGLVWVAAIRIGYYALMFAIKTTLLVIALSIVRALMARLRIEQFLEFSWKWVIPVSLGLIIVSLFWIPWLDGVLWNRWEGLFVT
ncbi:MAG: NADH-quinone oxidoreductase subunit H [Candidatus Heimdallarchaeota archaeon]|nr:NADH-quinone oxidoreductase subunit H [Candidatus Heimdallarchaeota archaeon]MBY8993981.1 NADH-quinone oxidoreductase subunit H [Candidatus Heimdallarchaeota archaeon]